MTAYTQAPWTYRLARRAGGFEALGRLRHDCASAGLEGGDALSAITSYFEHGALTTADLMELKGLAGPERQVFMVGRWGVDGSRVAVLVAARSGV